MNIEFKATTIEALTAEMEQIQQQLTQEIATVSVSGDIAKIQEISAKSATMVELFQQRLDQITQGNLSESESPYLKFGCELDLDLTVYDGDRDYYLSFTTDPDIQKAYQLMMEQNPESTVRKHLLKSSMRLTPLLAPELYAIGDKCKKALGLNKKIEFYIYQNDQFNAACYPPDDEQLYIIVTSALIEKFDIEELTFVIGHEIGHAIFLHHQFPANTLMEYGEEFLSPLHAMKLFAWKRNAEVTADRVGMICCQDFEVVGRAFFKLSSGVTSGSLDFELQEYIGQFSDLEQVLTGDDVDPEDWYSTHPFSPLRIKALELFRESETYHTLINKKGGSITEEEMEQGISRMMSLMEPVYLSGDSENGRKIQEFIFWSGFLVTLADGKIEQSELYALSSIVASDIFNNNVEKAKRSTKEEVKDIVSELSVDVNALFSVMQKLNILRDLSIISAADGEIDETEVDILYRIAYTLNINPEFIDKVINDITSNNDD